MDPFVALLLALLVILGCVAAAGAFDLAKAAIIGLRQLTRAVALTGLATAYRVDHKQQLKALLAELDKETD